MAQSQSLEQDSNHETVEQVEKHLNDQKLRYRTDRNPPHTEIYLDDCHSMFVFGEASNRLERMDIGDKRLRFATWDVIGEPVHKVVRFFKCADEETLWCDFFETDEQIQWQNTPAHKRTQAVSDAELLRAGTLWIPALGLGFSLKKSIIQTVPLCDPDKAPRFGTGTWNRPQQVMSETGILPEARPLLPSR